jgi:hypothetical protein
MKFIIFIADAIRHGNFPRVDQFEYSPEYGLYIYLGRELTVSEFNEASKRVFDPDFRNQGFIFRPQAVGSEVDAAIQAEADAAEALRIATAEAEAQRLADEAKAAEALKDEEPPVKSDEEPVVAPEWKAPDPGAEYVVAVDIVAVPVAEPIEASPPSEAETPPEPEAEPVKFRLDGKGIFVGEERVAGLFGEAKQLRVLAAHDALRPEIEAWLLTLTPSDQ